MSAYDLILFDLDGTLTDPKQGITRSVQYALQKFDILEEDLNKLEPFIGPPLLNSFMEFYAFDEEKARLAVAYYREYFTASGMLQNKIYPQITDMLEKLLQRGCSMMVVTSKPGVFAEKILEHFQIQNYFLKVVGSNLDLTMTDKTELIQAALGDSLYKKEQIVMVGDRKYDIIGARNNGISSIGVAYGYGSRDELINAQPTFLVSTVQELEAVLLNLAESLGQ